MSDAFVQDPSSGWRMDNGPQITRPERSRVSDIARQRLLEAVRLSAEAEEHLLRCLVCPHTAHCAECRRELCKVGRQAVVMARTARALALAHAEGRA